MTFSLQLHNTIITLSLYQNCLYLESKSLFIFLFWFFLQSLRLVRVVQCLYINRLFFNLKKVVVRVTLTWILDDAYNVVQWPNSNFNDDILILTTLFLLLGSVCVENMMGFSPVVVSFFSFFLISSSVLKSTRAHFQSNHLIYFCLRCGPLLFIIIYFILYYPWN